MFVPPVTFARNGPFYWLITTFVAASHGYLELVSRGVKQRLGSATLSEALIAGLESQNVENLRAVMDGGITGLIGKHALHARQGEPLHVEVSTLANEVFENGVDSIQFVTRAAASSLLLLAWDLTVAHHTAHPTWEFLRHCRNAAAHNGRLHFRRGEPRRPAMWRSLSLNASQHGMPLISSECPGLLYSGDVVYLLADIEKNLIPTGDDVRQDRD